MTRPIVPLVVVPVAILVVAAVIAAFGVVPEDRGEILVLGATAALGVMAVTVAWQQAKVEELAARAARSQLELRTLDLAERQWFRGPIDPSLGVVLNEGRHEPITTIEDARSSALRAYERNPERWSAISGRGQHWGPYVYDVARRLEHAGLASFMGAASLRTLLALLGSTVAEDWITAERHVTELRRIKGESAQAPVRRRHAEWLGLVALCWAASREPEHRLLGDWAKVRYPDGRSEVASRIRLLIALEPEMLGRQTAEELRKLVGIDPFDAAKDAPLGWFDREPSDPSQ